MSRFVHSPFFRIVSEKNVNAARRITVSAAIFPLKIHAAQIAPGIASERNPLTNRIAFSPCFDGYLAPASASFADFSNARLITIRCTSEEPSPISLKRASRQ
jgi:hypothetical protein